MYVEKLVFPQQIVNGVHVHFKPEDWGPIVKELTQKELESIIFYWHKHPDGCPGASTGDEEDTFDVFMLEEAGRKCFGFLQTSASTDGSGLKYEARIELREPVKVSITDVEIVTDNDLKIEKECNKIIKKHITRGTASTYDQPGVISSKKEEDEKEETKYSDDTDEHTFKVETNNGQLILTINGYFETWVISILDEDEISKLIADYKTDKIKGKTDEVELIINPHKKCIKKLFKYFKGLRDEMFYEEGDKNLEKEIGNTRIAMAKFGNCQMANIDEWYR